MPHVRILQFVHYASPLAVRPGFSPCVLGRRTLLGARSPAGNKPALL